MDYWCSDSATATGGFRTPVVAKKAGIQRSRRMLRNPDDAHNIDRRVLKPSSTSNDYRPEFQVLQLDLPIALNEFDHLLNGRKRLERSWATRSMTARRRGRTREQQLSRGVQGALMTIKAEYRAVIVLSTSGLQLRGHRRNSLQLPEKTVKSSFFQRASSSRTRSRTAESS